MNRKLRLIGLVLSGLVCGAGLGGGLAKPAMGEVRALPQGTLPDDVRLGNPRTLDDYFPFTPPRDAAEWTTEAEKIRRRALVATGLWPLPAATEPGAVIHGKVDREDYTVERVRFQSWPGHWVTGSLYRPKGKSGKLPAVLSPHGHWNNGRFYDHGEKTLADELKSGGEKFPLAGRFPLQARCVQLARMGCVVFQHDMVGYADSIQIPHRTGHRPALDTDKDWGFFSTQAELRLQTTMGLQTYNTLRAFEFLASLPDVDPARVGVTGASGGGTQTFILNAIDARPAASFPAVMVSTAMQGGCTCENASYLRIGVGNIHYAAACAPRPQGLTGANDWTKEIMTKGYPELKQLYRLLGQEEKMAATKLEFGHNYNHPSRHLMYQWMNKHLSLGLKDEQLVEKDFKPLSRQEMTVWTEDQPKPAVGEAYERSLLKLMTETGDRQIAALLPREGGSFEPYKQMMDGAMGVMFPRELPEFADMKFEEKDKSEFDGYVRLTGVLRNQVSKEELPGLFFVPTKDWNKRGVIWLSAKGKSALLNDDDSMTPQVQSLLTAGYAVVGLDLMLQGEFTADGKAAAVTRLNGSGKETWKNYAGYTFGYNDPLIVQRANDVLNMMSMALNSDLQIDRMDIVALDAATAPVAAAVRWKLGQRVGKMAVRTEGFRFAGIKRIDDPAFLPGAVKYGDLPAMLALSAPHPTLIFDEKVDHPLFIAAFGPGGGPATFQQAASQEAAAKATVEWLISN